MERVMHNGKEILQEKCKAYKLDKKQQVTILYLKRRESHI
jgi:hypothetical protein